MALKLFCSVFKDFLHFIAHPFPIFTENKFLFVAIAAMRCLTEMVTNHSSHKRLPSASDGPYTTV